RPGLDADELVDVVVCLGPNVLAGLQRHHDQLHALRREEHLAEPVILQRLCFDVRDVTRHFSLLARATSSLADQSMRMFDQLGTDTVTEILPSCFGSGSGLALAASMRVAINEGAAPRLKPWGYNDAPQIRDPPTGADLLALIELKRRKLQFGLVTG